MTECAVNVHGIKARLRSPNADFIEFVQRNYQYFLSSATDYDIEIFFSYYPWRLASRKHPTVATDEFTGLGSGIYYRAEELIQVDNGGLTIQLQLRDDRLVVHSFFWEKHRPSIRQWLFRRSALEQSKLQKYQDIMRHIVHFPIFWLLERRGGMALLHASAVEKEGQGLVFAGLNGSGKTTLAMHLCLEQGWRILSDNFLLTDGERTYAFPEVMRFDQKSLDLLQLDKQSFVPVYGKYHYELDPTSIASEAEPAAIFLTRLGCDTSIVPIEARRALARITGIHGFLKEFPEYSYFALMPFIVPDSDPPPDRTEILGKLFRKGPCYELQIGRGQTLEQVGEQVAACI